MLIESIVQPVRHHLGPNDTLLTAASLLENAAITALPVTSDDGTLLGLTCPLSAEVASLARQARIQKHTHVLVVDDLDSVVGIADLGPNLESSQEVQQREAALDEALKGTFPASDPVSLP